MRAYAMLLVLAAAAMAQTPPSDAANLPLLQGWYRGEPVTFRDYHGQALVEGDMLLGPTADLLRPPDAKSGPRETAVITGDRFRWTDRVIPYEIDPAIPNQGRVTQAVQAWNDSTILTLRPRESEANYVRFTRVPSGCSASVGMIGGRQLVNLGDECSLGNTIHEIGHAVGLHHTQSRNDRNLRLRVLPENVNPSERSQYDQAIVSREDVGAYDYGAIMHYSNSGFAISGRAVFETIPAGIVTGQRASLSASEIQAVARLYGEPVRETIIDTWPTGQLIEVDGETVITPKRYEWAPGQRHRLTARSMVFSPLEGSELRFARWSDGGDLSHEITAEDGGGAFVAAYATYYRVRTGVLPAGSGEAAVWPPSEDGFYPAGTRLRISATPAAGWKFFAWEAGAGGVTYLAANLQGNGANPMEYNVRANNAVYVARFMQGDFTVITSNPPGAAISVDNAVVYTPRHVSWAPGSVHTLSVAESQSPFSATATRLRFGAWSDGGERTHTVTASPAPATISLELRQQHLILTGGVSTRAPGVALPPAIRLDPAGESGWFDAGAAVQLIAPDPDNARFVNWTGDVSGAANPMPVTVSGPVLAVANYQSPRLLAANSVVNQASRQPRTMSPGALTTILVPGVGPEKREDFFPPVASAAGLSVEVAGKPASIAVIERGAVTFVCPLDVPVHRPATVRLQGVSDGQPIDATVTVPVIHAAPGIYTADGSGMGPALTEGSASRGSVVRVLVTGLDTSSLNTTRAFVDGYEAPVLGIVDVDAGRWWVELRVPDLASSGAVPVTIEAAGSRSQLIATLTIP